MNLYYGRLRKGITRGRGGFSSGTLSKGACSKESLNNDPRCQQAFVETLVVQGIRLYRCPPYGLFCRGWF
eukprot:4231583-Pyramimonas_sp.AAC.1